MAAWRHVAHTHRAVAIRCKRIWKDGLYACFTEFAPTVKSLSLCLRALFFYYMEGCVSVVCENTTRVYLWFLQVKTQRAVRRAVVERLGQVQ